MGRPQTVVPVFCTTRLRRAVGQGLDHQGFLAYTIPRALVAGLIYPFMTIPPAKLNAPNAVPRSLKGTHAGHTRAGQVRLTES
jgi:hypothetical protein